MIERYRPRIVIADDHTLIAEACKELLETEFEVAAIVNNGQALIDSVCLLNPDEGTMPFGKRVGTIKGVSSTPTGLHFPPLMLLLTLSLVILQGCAARKRLRAVPDALESKAYVPGLDAGIRYFPRDPAHVQLFID